MKLRSLFRIQGENAEALIVFYRKMVYPYVMKNELKSIKASVNEIDQILNSATSQALTNTDLRSSLLSTTTTSTAANTTSSTINTNSNVTTSMNNNKQEKIKEDNKEEEQKSQIIDNHIKRPYKQLLTIKPENIEKIDDETPNPERISTYCTIVPLKDPLVSPEYTDEEEIDQETIIYTDNKTIQYISINLFLKKITIDPSFLLRQKEIIKGFLQQCSAFIKFDILIEKIINTFAFFNTKDPNLFKGNLMNNLIQLLNNIILKHYDQIGSNDKLRSSLISFYENLSKTREIQSILFLLCNNCEKFDVDYIDFITTGLPPSSQNVYIKYQLPTKPSSNKYFSIFDWDVMAIASQLTLITRVMISNIGEGEIISAKFAKKTKQQSSPNILNLIKRFDDLIFFIIEEVLSYDQKKVRALVIEKWIQIGDACHKMNNFNDSMIITTALINHMLNKLHKTWTKVRKEYLEMFDGLKTLCTCQSSYINIRKAINYCIETNQPYIPYLGILLKEIAYYEENMCYITEKKMINVGKIEKVATSIKKFSQFKSFPYTYRPLSQLKIFEKLTPLDEPQLEDILRQLEPTFTLHVHKKNEKRSTQTDIKYFNQKPTQSGHLVRAKNVACIFEDDFYK